MVRKWQFNVAGVVNGSRIRQCLACKEGDAVSFRRSPRNRHDPNAIEVWVRRKQIGFVPADIAATLARPLDAGEVTVLGIVADVFEFEGDDGEELAGMTVTVEETFTGQYGAGFFGGNDLELPESLREKPSAAEAFPTFTPDNDWNRPAKNAGSAGCFGSVLVTLVVVVSVFIAIVR